MIRQTLNTWQILHQNKGSDSLWISVPAVSKLIGTGGQRSVRLAEVVFGISIIISTQSTEKSFIAAGERLQDPSFLNF